MDFDEKATRDYLRELILNLYSISEELNDETELVASGIIDSFGTVSYTHLTLPTKRIV